MKKLGKLKLNQLSKAGLEKKEMNMIKGGCNCVCSWTCSCNYAGEQCPSGDDFYGGASTVENYNANDTSSTNSAVSSHQVS